MSDLTIQRGELFVRDGVRRNAAGVPVNLTTAAITVTSCVKKADGSFTSALAVTIPDQDANPGAYHVEGDSSEWPTGQLRWQIKFTRSGQVVGNVAQWFNVTQGSTGSSATAARPYVHLQTDAATMWIVNHNLGRKPAGVEVTTPGGLSILVEVVHVSTNQLRVYLAQPGTGSVSVF